MELASLLVIDVCSRRVQRRTGGRVVATAWRSWGSSQPVSAATNGCRLTQQRRRDRTRATTSERRHARHSPSPCLNWLQWAPAAVIIFWNTKILLKLSWKLKLPWNWVFDLLCLKFAWNLNFLYETCLKLFWNLMFQHESCIKFLWNFKDSIWNVPGNLLKVRVNIFVCNFAWNFNKTCRNLLKSWNPNMKLTETWMKHLCNLKPCRNILDFPRASILWNLK